MQKSPNRRQAVPIQQPLAMHPRRPIGMSTEAATASASPTSRHGARNSTHHSPASTAPVTRKPPPPPPRQHGAGPRAERQARPRLEELVRRHPQGGEDRQVLEPLLP